MKILLKSIIMVLLLTAGFANAQAQGKGGRDMDPAKRADKQTTMMAEKLGLSADQTVKVKAINQQYAEKAKATFGDKEKGEKGQNREAHQALRTEQNAELSKVLTKDQAAKWEQMKADRKGEGRGEGKAKGAGRDFDPAKRAEQQTDRMAQELNLNADQTAKVKAINQKYAEQAKAAHEAKADGDKGKTKGANKDLRAQHDAELKKVLTKEQAAKWEQLKSERKGQRGDRDKQKGKSNKSDLKKG